MGRPLKIAKKVPVGPSFTQVEKIGTFGNTSQTGSQLQVTCNVAYADRNLSNVTATGYIVRQTGNRKFECNVPATGIFGICSLTTVAGTSIPAGTKTGTGSVRISAVDSAGKNYFVSKITTNRVTVIQAAPWTGPMHVYANNASVAWTFGTAYGAGSSGNVQLPSA